MGIILRSDLNLLDQANYRAHKAWKALHFVMRVLKEGDRKTKRVAYTSLVRPIVEYGSACWDPCRGQINALDRVQKKAAQFTNHIKDSDWEILGERRKIARICALFRAYCGERSWKAVRDRLIGPYCLSRVDHVWEIKDRNQRTDVGNYSFVNWTVKKLEVTTS